MDAKKASKELGLNVDIGNINLQIKLADSVEGIVRNYVDRKIELEVKTLRQALETRPIPNAQGSVE